MFINYGSEELHLNTEKVPNYTCKNCASLNTTYLTITLNYFYLYWVPFCATQKNVYTKCENCHQYIDKKQFSNQLDFTYSNIKLNTKIPIWPFSGLFIVIGLILMMYLDKIID